MTNMRANKPLLLLFLAISLAVAFGARVAQNRKTQEANQSSMSNGRSAEPDKETRGRSALANLLAAVGVRVEQTLPLSESQKYKELRVRWQSSGTAAQAGTAAFERRPARGAVTLVNSRRRDGVLSRERSFELSTNQILMIALDQKGELRWWRLLLDPRVVRSETPGPGGEISGEDYYLTKVDFIVAYPDDPTIKEVRFYHPSWTGQEFQLEILSSLAVE
jgi:hypothetical protein